MSLEEVEVPHIRPGVETTGDTAEAPNTSSDSSEQPKGRRERKGRVATAVASAESRCPAGGSLRVLRVRTAVAVAETTKNVTCRARPASPLPGRGRAAGSRCMDSPDTRAANKKKSTAIKVTPAASKHTLRPKRSKSVKGKGRSRAAAPPAACKPEAEMKGSSCGEETDVLEESNEAAAHPEAAPDEDPPGSEGPDDLICQPETKMKKSKQCASLQQEEVKKEESGEEEEREVKREEVTQNKEGEASNTEPSRKRSRPSKDSEALRQPKRRKKPPVQYVRCEVEGCGTVLAHPRYLQHHIKYQHLLKKKYVCDHPSCGRLFRLQKQLLRHAKHHTDQRDYICEFCARAFKSSHNLAVHRMIHTGEKPIQCEICGFTCRQKASLNWHMKKHDAEASYQFSCSVCGKKFEKKDCVVAHKAKSHPEVLLSEALEANGGTLIKCPASFTETVSTDTQPEQPSVSRQTQEGGESRVSKEGGALTPLQQVVLPLAPQTPIDVPQGQFLQLPTHHVVQAAHQQQAPALLHITTAPPPHPPTSTLPQFIQIPAGTVAPSTTTQSALVTLSSVNTLASQPAGQWGREGEEFAHMPGEGELWEKVIVGREHKDVMIWERRKEEEGLVWEREGERQILLQCAEADRDHLI